MTSASWRSAYGSAYVRRWIFPLCVLLLTCFGVFILPFLLPPPYLAGVSAANVAGFNNKVAAVAAAALGVAVFATSLRWPWLKPRERNGDFRPLASWLMATGTIVVAVVNGLVGYLIAISRIRYLDASYFIQQISMNADYGRKLYDQIEFPYGPLLFYGPIVMRTLLSPLHISLTAAYQITLVMYHVTGLLLLAYVVNRLPILSRWKTLLFVLCLPQTIQLNGGLNYIFPRFLIPAAFLVLGARQRRPWATAACFFVGVVVSLAVSPEMGFAFGAASVAYAILRCLTGSRVWLAVAATPFLGTAMFLVAAGGGYLRMLKLFAHGVYNFIVEPLPHVVIFLFALVWLVPCGLALSFRERRREAPLLAALYILSLALLPVAFGRADAGHVFFNGLLIYLLSFAAISSLGRRPQLVWAIVGSGALLWTAFIDIRNFQYEFRGVVHYDVLHFGSERLKHAALTLTHLFSPSAAEHYLTATYSVDDSLDIQKLQSIVGSARIATPLPIPLPVEAALQRSGQYTPSFYCFHIAVLDAQAERHEIQELNESAWALVPRSEEKIRLIETTANSSHFLGFGLPYRTVREPYQIGALLEQNLKENWESYGAVGNYVVYRRR